MGNPVYNSHLIRQSFQGYRCKSGIAILAWGLENTISIHGYIIKNYLKSGIQASASEVKHMKEYLGAEVRGLGYLSFHP